jgi:hypothetical protein
LVSAGVKQIPRFARNDKAVLVEFGVPSSRFEISNLRSEISDSLAFPSEASDDIAVGATADSSPVSYCGAILACICDVGAKRAESGFLPRAPLARSH